MGVIIGVIGVIYLLCFIPVSYSYDRGARVRGARGGARDGAPLGVADKSIINDNQLSASSKSKDHRAKHGRLNGDSAWRPDKDGEMGEWIQVTFDTLVNVTEIATQGRNPNDSDDNEYVTQYKVQYNYKNGDSLTYERNAGDTNDRVFTGNVDRGSTVVQVLHNAVFFTRFRIVIVECSVDGCALRFEVYGCEVPVCEVLVTPTNGRVTNSGTDFTGSQTIVCKAGFTPMGEISTECTGNGDSATWEPDITLTTCVPICDVLNAPMNGHVTNAMTTVFTEGDMQMIECRDGFTAMGETSTVCTATRDGRSATWEPDITSTTCEKYTPASTTAEKYTPASTTAEKYTLAPTTAEKNTLEPTTAEKYTPASTTAEKYTPASTTISSTSIYSMKDERISGRKSNPGAVAGPVIGVLLVIVIIIIVVIWLLKRKRKTAKPTLQSGQAFDGPYELTIEGNNGPAKTQPTLIGQPGQEEYAYVDVNRANTPQNEVKPDTGDIYQDVQDKPDEYAYAYADVNASKTADEPSDDGLVHIYAKSKHGGRPITKDKQNPAADTGDIYQTIQEDPNENEYAYADVKVDANGKPANPQEGWEDNVIYAEGNDDEGIAADKRKEGWVDNNIYATTDNDAQNAEGKSQVEGWEDNIIYGDK